MSKPALRLLSEHSSHRDQTSTIPLWEAVAPGKLVELSGAGSVARTTTAVSILRNAQVQGETAAWIQPRGGPLFPLDLHDSLIDLGALVVIHIPEPSGSAGQCRAAELLLRSGAFGLVVIDLSTMPPPPGSAWQGRLLGLARQHHSRVVVLTDTSTDQGSLGPLVAMRIEPQRERLLHGIVVEHLVLKNKSGAPVSITCSAYRGPPGAVLES